MRPPMKTASGLSSLATILLWGAAQVVLAAAGPVFSDTGPDVAAYDPQAAELRALWRALVARYART